MNRSQCNNRRIRRTYRQTINAKPAVVFPLLCPVREADWLDGWQYTMIYSKCGLVEEGAIFSTPFQGEEDTIWIVTKHDSNTFKVDFARVTPNSRTSILCIAVTPKGDNGSYVDISYTYTAIAPAGNDFIDHFTEEAFKKAVSFWERSMNHYLETGRKLEKA